MQMIQDGQYANAPEKPLRMTGTAEACRVCLHAFNCHSLVKARGRAHYHIYHICPASPTTPQ